MVRFTATDATSVAVDSIPPLVDPHRSAGPPLSSLHRPASLPWLAGFFLFKARGNSSAARRFAIPARATLWHKAGMSPLPPPRWYARHLREVGESYPEHAAFAVRIAARCAWASVQLVVHAALPFLFERGGSRTLERVQAEMAARAKRRTSTAPAEGADR